MAGEVSTTLTEPVAAGSIIIQIASTAGFNVGDDIVVEDEHNSEVNQINGFGSIILHWPLVNSYSAGATIRVVQAEWALGSDAAGCEVNDQGINRTFGSDGFTLESCKEKCEQESKCMAIDYYSETGWCNLFDVSCSSPSFVLHGASHHVLEALPMQHAGEGACGPGGSECRRCQGDCNTDSDCLSGLACFQRSAGEAVPGCNTGGTGDVGHYDYCALVDAVTLAPTAAPAPGARGAVNALSIPTNGGAGAPGSPGSDPGGALIAGGSSTAGGSASTGSLQGKKGTTDGSETESSWFSSGDGGGLSTTLVGLLSLMGVLFIALVLVLGVAEYKGGRISRAVGCRKDKYSSDSETDSYADTQVSETADGLGGYTSLELESPRLLAQSSSSRDLAMGSEVQGAAQRQPVIDEGGEPDQAADRKWVSIKHHKPQRGHYRPPTPRKQPSIQ